MKKIASTFSPHPCRHPMHDPPGHIVLSPGVWEHSCPGCEAVTHVMVSGEFLSVPSHPTSLGNVWVGVTRPDFSRSDITRRHS